MSLCGEPITEEEVLRINGVCFTFGKLHYDVVFRSGESRLVAADRCQCFNAIGSFEQAYAEATGKAAAADALSENTGGGSDDDFHIGMAGGGGIDLMKSSSEDDGDGDSISSTDSLWSFIADDNDGDGKDPAVRKRIRKHWRESDRTLQPDDCISDASSEDTSGDDGDVSSITRSSTSSDSIMMAATSAASENATARRPARSAAVEGIQRRRYVERVLRSMANNVSDGDGEVECKRRRIVLSSDEDM